MDLNNTQFLRPAVPIGFKAKISPEKQKEILNHLKVKKSEMSTFCAQILSKIEKESVKGKEETIFPCSISKESSTEDEEGKEKKEGKEGEYSEIFKNGDFFENNRLMGPIRRNVVANENLSLTNYAYYHRNPTRPILSDRIANRLAKNGDHNGENSKRGGDGNTTPSSISYPHHKLYPPSEISYRSKTIKRLANRNTLSNHNHNGKRENSDCTSNDDFNQQSSPDESMNGSGEIKKVETYCICEKPYTDGSLMIFCEGPCGNWYHPSCLDISLEEVDMIKKSKEAWICKKCAHYVIKTLAYHKNNSLD